MKKCTIHKSIVPCCFCLAEEIATSVDKKNRKFSIYVNDAKLLFQIDGTKKAAKEFIKMFLKSTHMGEWRKIDNGYEYATTIGRYYKFLKE